jgi:hypothetical protein
LIKQQQAAAMYRELQQWEQQRHCSCDLCQESLNVLQPLSPPPPPPLPPQQQLHQPAQRPRIQRAAAPVPDNSHAIFDFAEALGGFHV